VINIELLSTALDGMVNDPLGIAEELSFSVDVLSVNIDVVLLNIEAF